MRTDDLLKKMALVSLILCVLCLGAACEHRKKIDGLGPEEPQPTLSSIQNRVLTPKCVNAGCHPGGGAPMSLENGVARSNLVDVASAYPPLLRVRPGVSDSSVLYLKVTGDQNTGPRMPLGGQALSQEEIDDIAEWIEDGALND
jgi:hypothetical protein